MSYSMKNLNTKKNPSFSGTNILNNYSNKNLISYPSYIEPYTNIPKQTNNFTKNNLQNSYSHPPKQILIEKIIPITIVRSKITNKMKNIIPNTIFKNRNKLRIINLNNSYKKTQKMKKIQKIISITKIEQPEKKKYPRDSIKKNKITNENKLINFNNDNNRLISKNSFSQKDLILKRISDSQHLKKNYDKKYPRNSKSKKKTPHNSKSIYNEPNEDLNLKEFIFEEQIGKGTFGKIFSIKWIKNNKIFALKKEKLSNIEEVDKRKNYYKIIKNFIKETNSKGVINLYGNLCLKKNKNNNEINNIKKVKNNYKKYIYYELMEKAERDWEKEINMRSELQIYYSEKEIINIMSQLIETLSLLEKYHISHRDIKPQNILIIDRKYKLCDFGELRQLKGEGLIIQRIRGSELYMSPILFNGLHLNTIQVKHNTYKSDVFSLGMCLFLALTLTYSSVDSIRELTDMKKIKEILFQYLNERYSVKIILFILSMLETDENKRPNFIQLEEKLKKLYCN